VFEEVACCLRWFPGLFAYCCDEEPDAGCAMYIKQKKEAKFK